MSNGNGTPSLGNDDGTLGKWADVHGNGWPTDWMANGLLLGGLDGLLFGSLLWLLANELLVLVNGNGTAGHWQFGTG
jgi:hypothetical protein